MENTAIRRTIGLAMALVLAFGMSVPVTAAHAASELAAAALTTTAGDSAGDEGAADNTFTFSDSGITAANANGSGYEVSGTDLSITADGTYVLAGSCAQGSVSVGKKLSVKLVIDGTGTAFSLANANGPAIECGKNSNVAIVNCGTSTVTTTCADEKAIQAKSGSTLTVGGQKDSALNVSGTKFGIKGAAESTVNIGASTGDDFTLNVASGKNGIAADGTLVMWGGTVNVGTASAPVGNDGLKSEPDGDDDDSAGQIIVRGGTITVYASGDGVQASYETEYEDSDGNTQVNPKTGTTQGKVTIAGGTLNITAGCDGVQAADTLAVYGGTVNATTNGGSETGRVSTADSCKGLKSDKLVLVQDGTFNLNTSDDCIHSDGNVELYGGTFTLKTHNSSTKPDNMSSSQITTPYIKGGDAVHADYITKIGKVGGTSGAPRITVTDCYEGLEGAEVLIYDGTTTITATDDGINAANSDFSNSYAFAILFAGGTTSVNSGSDGIDSNRDIYVTGGTTFVSGASSGDGDAVDYGDSNSHFVVSGGTFVAYGQGGNMMGGGMGGPGMGGFQQGGFQQGGGSYASTPTSGYYVEFGSGAGQGVNMGGGMQPGQGQSTGQGQGPGQRSGGFQGVQGIQGAQGVQAFNGGLQASGNALVSKGTAFSVKVGDTVAAATTALKDASYVLLAGSPVASSGLACTLTAGSSTTTATSAGSAATATFTPSDTLAANESATFDSSATTSGVDASYSGITTPATPSTTTPTTDETTSNETNGNSTTETANQPTTTTPTDTTTSNATTTTTTGKKANTMKVAVGTKRVSSAQLISKAKAVKALYVTKAKGTVKYTRVSGSKHLKVNKKTGKITVTKGTKAGTYKVKVKVRAAGNTTYKAKAVTKTVKVVVR